MSIDKNQQSDREIQELQMHRIELETQNEGLRLAQASLQLKTQDFVRLLQVLPVAIVRTDDTGSCYYANPRAGEFAGRTVDELLGLRWLAVVHPDDQPKLYQARVALLAGTQVAPVEFRLLRPDGSLCWVLGNIVVELGGNGRVTGFILAISDTSELKHREELQRAQQRAQREALIREVHHRIKNNLQSVGGLLRRELTSCLECRPRLEKVITQVHAVATVHGLQGASPGGGMRLCDTVRQICQVVAEQSQRAVLFSIEEEDTRFVPVHIVEDEAVAVALVINELVFNAVKHSPSGAPAPTVTLSADGRYAQIVIVNACASTDCAARFAPTDAGTTHAGLRLVRSLLPLQGAELTYELQPGGQPGGEHRVMTRIRLCPPAVHSRPGDLVDAAQ